MFPVKAEDAAFIQEAFSLLTPQEQMVVKARILDGFTDRERLRNWECHNL